MIEETITGFGMPYREDLTVRAFSFGVDHNGNALGDGAAIEDLEPTLCLVAGLRGNEIQQTFICARMVKQLGEMERTDALAPGCLITVIPCANPASMSIGWRFWPGDKTDINRMFPGYDQGETTQRIAAALFNRVKGFRYGIHLSSFHLDGNFLPHVRVMHGDGTAENHGADFGFPYVLHHVPGSFDTTTLHYNWRLWDTEAYTLYTDETSQINEASADETVRAILRFADARGIVYWPNHRGYHAIELGEGGLVAVPSPTGGIFCPNVQVGDIVCEGDLLGEVIDTLRGTTKAELWAPSSGCVFYASHTPLMNEGTLAFQIVPPDAGATANSSTRGNFLDPEA
jgi:hypothetical protein